MDRAHLGNLLLQLPLDHAVWHFLAFCEEGLLLMPALKAMRGGDSTADERLLLADNVINCAKWPIRWLHQECRPGRIKSYQLDGGTYDACLALYRLSGQYMGVEAAFVCAGLGVVDLEVSGNQLLTRGRLLNDVAYEAYDRLAVTDDVRPLTIDVEPLDRVLEPRVRVSGSKFTYTIDRQLVKLALDTMAPDLARRFRLPPGWRLGPYTMGDHASVSRILWILSAIHLRARLCALRKRCIAGGYSAALCQWARPTLVNRIVEYSGVSRDVVDSVLRDMTYTFELTRSPDVALQPLVPFERNQVVWAPSLLMNSYMERNLIVLLNRRPETKAEYARLSTQRSELLRVSMERDLADLGLRFWHGSVGGWPNSLDIDLAIISDEERYCLLLELKAFIAPAEPREVRDRSEEIRKGVQQVLRRKTLAQTHPESLHRALGIDESYGQGWGVVSETSIGGCWVQDASVPIVRSGHFVRTVRERKSLGDVARWLQKRDYLPAEGTHFRRTDADITVGGWTLKWFDVEFLVDGLP